MDLINDLVSSSHSDFVEEYVPVFRRYDFTKDDIPGLPFGCATVYACRMQDYLALRDELEERAGEYVALFNDVAKNLSMNVQAVSEFLKDPNNNVLVVPIHGTKKRFVADGIHVVTNRVAAREDFAEKYARTGLCLYAGVDKKYRHLVMDECRKGAADAC